MKNNVVKLRLLKGEPALGIVLDMGSPTAAGILARAGFDFVVIDNQHGDWDDASSLKTVRSKS